MEPRNPNQPNTHLSLSITFPITITVASSTTDIPITFTVNRTTFSVAPIPRHHQYGLSQYSSASGALGLLLPTSTLTLPTVINVATDTMFLTTNVSATRIVHFSPIVNSTSRIPIRQRPRPFQIFNLTRMTDTASITLPIMITFNITVDADTTIVVNVVVLEDTMVVTSDTVTRIEDFIAILTMGSRH
ncbi:hypothetical protein TanjilG_07062 [Lupinus angustifolius]|uniref:Uncharacterized protein n=1 Tax=Lupinus angustifolius TaxID=3871 RepID=A0A4P1QXT4_LUPAN|nr:hypothetical protein TanjilG_07062 [Lupinus angustifolius]